MPFHLAHNLKTPTGYNHLFFLLIERLSTNFESRLPNPRIHKRASSPINKRLNSLQSCVSCSDIAQVDVALTRQRHLSREARVVYLESLLYIASSDGVFISSGFLASFGGRATSFFVLPPPSHSGHITHNRRPVWDAVERSSES